MGWEEQHQAVSRAFSDWSLIDHDQRAFLKLGLRIARDAYKRLWDEASQQPGCFEDDTDLVDAFERRVDGLWPHDYEWMYLAAVARDAVTNFEVYLEKASIEVLLAHRLDWARPPRWRELQEFFDQKLGVQIASEEVRRIRDLRHFLTHQRGELRTDAQREKFAANVEGIPSVIVELNESAVTEILDQLGDAVRTIDQAVWNHIFGGSRPNGLKPTP